MGRALHDRLCAVQFDIRIISDTEIAIPVAGKQMPDVAKSHFLIHFSIAATGNV